MKIEDIINISPDTKVYYVTEINNIKCSHNSGKVADVKMEKYIKTFPEKPELNGVYSVLVGVCACGKVYINKSGLRE